MKNDPFRPGVLAAERRAAQFLIPAQDGDPERDAAFKRACELSLSAAREFMRAGREDLTAIVHKALGHAELEDTDAPQL